MHDEDIYDEGAVDQGWDLPDFMQENPALMRDQAARILERADLLEIQKILPDVEAEVSAANEMGEMFPQGESITLLQGILGLEDQDGVLGHDTAKALLEKLTAEMFRDVDGETVAIDMSPHVNLSGKLYEMADIEFADYNSSVYNYNDRVGAMVEQNQREHLLNTAQEIFYNCELGEIDFDPKAYISEFIKDMEEGVPPDHMFTERCRGVLQLFEPEEQNAIIDNFFEDMKSYLADYYLILQAEDPNKPVMAAEPAPNTAPEIAPELPKFAL